MIELLSPAGDIERLKIAYLYGADACYIGGKEYSLRANANNFNREDIKEAVTFAHNLKKKLYVTVNIVFHNKDIEGLVDYLKFLNDINIDAIIVSDPLIIDLVKENNLKIPIHISTQNSTTNTESVRYWLEKGVERIVLAREVGKEDIKKIIQETGAEIEVFLHGAMCTCISGRCVLSNYFTNRDSNRGGCCQVCRFVFDLDKERNTKFSIATKDLNLGSKIPELIKMNVKSLKIEGRMRSTYYIATVISCYRNLIDAYYNNSFTKEVVDKTNLILSRVSNRESTTQFFEKEADEQDQYYIGREEPSNQDFLGVVLGYDEDNKMIILEQRNYFKPGDKINIFTPKGKEISLTVERIYNEEGKLEDAARHPRQILKIPSKEKIEKNSMIRIDFF